MAQASPKMQKMWWRFSNSALYDLALAGLIIAGLVLALSYLAPRLDTGLDRLFAWVGSVQPQYQGLFWLGVFVLLLWLGVTQLSLLMKVDR